MKLILTLMVAVALTACGEKKAEVPTFKEQKDALRAHCKEKMLPYMTEALTPYGDSPAYIESVVTKRCYQNPEEAMMPPGMPPSRLIVPAMLLNFGETVHTPMIDWPVEGETT